METVYQPIDSAPPPSVETIEAPMESRAEWTPASDEGELTLREATDLVGKRRRERGETDQGPIIERTYGDRTEPLSLREAAADRTFTRRLEQAKPLLDAGLSPQEALAAVQSDAPPTKVGLLDYKGNPLEPIEGRELRPGDEVSAHKAAKMLGDWREAEAQRQAALLEQLQGEPAQEQPQEQPQTTPQPQPELIQEHQRIAAERQAVAALKQMDAAEVVAATQLHQATNATMAAFNDVRSPADLERLRVTQPERFAQLAQAIQFVRAGQAQLAQHSQAKAFQQTQLAQHQQAQYQRAREAYAEQQDLLFEREVEKALPQFDRSELRQAAVNTLRSAGLNDKQIAAYYYQGAPIDMRSAGAQLLLAKAAAYDRAQAAAREVSRAKLPPVQRPGTARPAGAGNADTVRSLEKQLASASGVREQLRLATKLTQARRAMGE